MLIAINVIVYLVEIAGGRGGLQRPRRLDDHRTSASSGPRWPKASGTACVTSGFLHVGLFHIGFNMLLLYFLGRLLEPAIGTPRFVVLYFASLLAGSSAP